MTKRAALPGRRSSRRPPRPTAASPRAGKAGAAADPVPARAAKVHVRPIDPRKPGDSIGALYRDQLAQVALIDAGLPFGSIVRFQSATGLALGRITDVAGISVGTYSRRKAQGRLSSEESERLLRVSRVFERTVDLHRGDQAAAQRWLEMPIPSLGGRKPLDLARTEPGARAVEDLIDRVQHGVIS